MSRIIPRNLFFLCPSRTAAEEKRNEKYAAAVLSRAEKTGGKQARPDTRKQKGRGGLRRRALEKIK